MKLTLNKTGLAFAAASLMIGAAGYLAIELGVAESSILIPLMATGFGIPFFLALFAKGIAGCGIKDDGCITSYFIGFTFGSILLSAIYYGLGCLISALFRFASSDEKIG